MLGWVVVERQQHVEVLGDLRGRLGPLGAVVGVERLRGLERVVLVLGVVDLASAAFAPGCADLGSAASTLPWTWNQHLCSLVSGKTSRSAFQKPSAPSPTANIGARIPRRLQSRSRSAHDSLDSRKPSETAMSSFFPSARTPIITSRHTLSCSRRTLRWMPSTQQ